MGDGNIIKHIIKETNFLKCYTKIKAILVLADTGVGKTVIIPKLMAHYFDYKTPIIITIPTVKAVKSNTGYAAMCMDVQYGMEVACRTAEIDDELDPSRTKLLYATDGFISGKINNDPLLSQYEYYY